MEKSKNNEYVKKYRQAKKRQFNTDLKIEELEELEELLKKHNLTKVQFIRNAMEDLKKK